MSLRDKIIGSVEYVKDKMRDAAVKAGNAIYVYPLPSLCLAGAWSCLVAGGVSLITREYEVGLTAIKAIVIPLLYVPMAMSISLGHRPDEECIFNPHVRQTNLEEALVEKE